MDIIFEFIFELIVEGCIEGSKCKKIPKVLRFIMLSIVILFFGTIIGFLFYGGIRGFITNNIASGIFCTVIAFFMVFACVVYFRKKLKKTAKVNDDT